MNILEKSIQELIDLATTTVSMAEMLFLRNHPSMNVRRALATNNNITESILETLINDPVENVSYKASLYPKANEKKSFDENLRPCVTCEKAEKGLVCIGCPAISDHRF